MRPVNPSKHLTLTCVFAFAGAGAIAQDSAPQPYRFAPPEAWVEVVDDLTLADDQPVEDGESDFVLVDNQVRLSDVTSHYYRSIERLTSQDAVGRAAQISIYIDPEHEHVLLHDVRVLRGQRAIDKLVDARRSLLHREEELEAGILDGRVTLHLLLQDVRVGDVLDYSYTLERRDPFGGRGYHDWFTTQWNSPVRRLRLRILSPPDRPLVILDHSKLSSPVKSQRGGWVETVWNGQDIAALPGESSRPAWHFYYPRIEISEFASWQAVRAWARPMYEAPGSNDPDLRKLVAEVRREKAPRAQTLKALRFVQDDIRYTGLEMGAGAYRPTQPGVVLKRRFGDCKDKTLLLVTVLRQLGIEAWPALVHSRSGRGLRERAPGPGAFDHVIAKVRLQGKDYWLDATTGDQGGDLDSMVQADFGPALVLDESRGGLEDMPRREARKPNHHVLETYDLRQGRDKPARFTVRSQYHEEEADAMRAKMRSQTATALGKQYLDYYRKTYPNIRMIDPVKIHDDRVANLYTITESYEIVEPFEKQDNGSWKFFMEAYLVTDEAEAPAAAERTAPLARDFPMYVRHEIVAQLADDWNVEPSTVTIDDPAFRYSSRVAYRKGRLHLSYDLRNAVDHVPADRLAEYRKNIRRVYDDAFFTLTDRDGAAARFEAPAGPSWFMLVALPVGLLGGALSVRLLEKRGWRPPPTDITAREGMAGWLSLPAVLTLLMPLFAAGALGVLLNDFGAASSFAGLDAMQKVLRVAQMYIVCEMLVVASYAGWRLWKRAPVFPLLFHVVMLEVVVLALIELALRWRAGEFLLSPVSPLIGPLMVMSLAVGSSVYMWRSQRVRATFAPRSLLAE